MRPLYGHIEAVWDVSLVMNRKSPSSSRYDLHATRSASLEIHTLCSGMATVDGRSLSQVISNYRCVCLSIYLSVCRYECMYMCVCFYVYHVCMHVCMCVCIYVCTYGWMQYLLIICATTNY